MTQHQEKEWTPGPDDGWHYVHELTKALTGLTAGGSEFFIRRGERYIADIPACVEYVRRRERSQHEEILRRARIEKELRDELAKARGPTP